MFNKVREIIHFDLYEILGDLLKIFDKNGIEYYFHAGTLLGLIRHQGIIPWDIDIDITVKSSEYDKLREILFETAKYKVLFEIENASHKPLAPIRILSKQNTYYWSAVNNCSTHIDIFLIEETKKIPMFFDKIGYLLSIQNEFKYLNAQFNSPGVKQQISKKYKFNTHIYYLIKITDPFFIILSSINNWHLKKSQQKIQNNLLDNDIWFKYVAATNTTFNAKKIKLYKKKFFQKDINKGTYNFGPLKIEEKNKDLIIEDLTFLYGKDCINIPSEEFINNEFKSSYPEIFTDYKQKISVNDNYNDNNYLELLHLSYNESRSDYELIFRGNINNIININEHNSYQSYFRNINDESYRLDAFAINFTDDIKLEFKENITIDTNVSLIDVNKKKILEKKIINIKNNIIEIKSK